MGLTLLIGTELPRILASAIPTVIAAVGELESSESFQLSLLLGGKLTFDCLW